MSLSFFCWSFNLVFAQADLCNSCYVWSFTNDKGERDETTRLLTDAVEDIISQYPSCILLQRSRFAKLQEQIANEKAIQSLNSAPSAIKDELKVIQAKRVIFGSVSRDFQGSVSLRLTFESLTSSQFKSNTIFLTGEDYYNFDKRKEKLTTFVNSFINPDGKMSTPTSSQTTLSNSKNNNVISSQTNGDLKCTITKFEQNSDKAIFYFTLENINPARPDVNFMTASQNAYFIDQEGNQYYCAGMLIGNQRDAMDIIYQNPIKCQIEFNVGSLLITKAAKLVIAGYGGSGFAFINLKTK